MKITLEVLKEKGASELDIKCFEKFCLYREQKEFGLVEFFVKQGGTIEDFDIELIYKSIDNVEELGDLVNYFINKKLSYPDGFHRTFDLCLTIYKQDLELCKKAMYFYLETQSPFSYDYILRTCSDFLELLPELRKALQNCVDSLNAVKKLVDSLNAL